MSLLPREMQAEFDAWGRTITRTYRISIGLVILGGLLAFVVYLTTGSIWSLLILMAFLIAGMINSHIIGDYLIKKHEDKIDRMRW